MNPLSDENTPKGTDVGHGGIPDYRQEILDDFRALGIEPVNNIAPPVPVDVLNNDSHGLDSDMYFFDYQGVDGTPTIYWHHATGD